MSIKQMRKYILDHYPGWHEVQHMKPNQVIAIYNKIRERKKKVNTIEPEAEYHQLTIAEYCLIRDQGGLEV